MVSANYQDYVKSESDGLTALLTVAGRKIAKEFIAKNGGVTGTMRITGLSKTPIQNVRDNGSCHPDAWQKIHSCIYAAYKANQTQHAA